MTADQLREFRNRVPFMRFVINTANGRTFEINEPDALVLPKDWTTDAIVTMPRGRFAFVSLAHVTHVEVGVPEPDRHVHDPPYVSQLIDALGKQLKGAEVNVEQVRKDRYRFIVVWGGFDALGHPERQQMVWDLAEQALTNKKDLLKVTMILTMGLEDVAQE